MKKVSIVGMGALGIMYGTFFKNNAPEIDLDFVMDNERAEKYKNEIYSVNGKDISFKITTPENASPADLLIVSVKSTGLEAALDVMKNSINEKTLILSVINGITSEEIISERYPFAHVIHCIAQGMDCMKLGNEVSFSSMGELRFGTPDENKEYALQVKAFFEEINMPHTYEEDILYRIWSKFMVNVGINQTCMAYGIGYGKALEKGEANRTLLAAFREVISVANAEGIGLTDDDINYYIDILSKFRYDSCPSMAQDRINKKPSEVEIFAGTMLKLGKKHGLYLPTNEFLYEKIKEIENEYVKH